MRRWATWLIPPPEAAHCSLPRACGGLRRCRNAEGWSGWGIANPARSGNTHSGRRSRAVLMGKAPPSPYPIRQGGDAPGPSSIDPGPGDGAPLRRNTGFGGNSVPPGQPPHQSSLIPRARMIRPQLRLPASHRPQALRPSVRTSAPSRQASSHRRHRQGVRGPGAAAPPTGAGVRAGAISACQIPASAAGQPAPRRSAHRAAPPTAAAPSPRWRAAAHPPRRAASRSRH